MSNTALAEREPTTIAPMVTADQLDLVKRTVATGATDAELKLFLYDCQRQGVHPLDRLLHFTKRGGKYTPVTSIDLMRTRAADTGEYAGSSDARFEGKPGTEDFAAYVVVSRLVQGHRCEFGATARWSEYYPGDQSGHMWKKMPHTMLAKCAEALALRKGFPRQLAGLYAREELDQADRGTSPAVVPDPPATVIDTATGAEVPADAKPEPPPGFVYLHSVSVKNGFYEVWLTPNGVNKGGANFVTKRETIGVVALQAYQQGVPVKLEHKGGSRWLDGVTTWKPDAPAVASGAPLDASSIPF